MTEENTSTDAAAEVVADVVVKEVEKIAREIIVTPRGNIGADLSLEKGNIVLKTDRIEGEAATIVAGILERAERTGATIIRVFEHTELGKLVADALDQQTTYKVIRL